MIDVQRLKTALPVAGLGEPLYVFSSIGSTNDEAKSLAEGGAPHGTLVLADTQLKGRGRHGRKWYSEPGSGIALSLVLRPDRAGFANNTLTVLGALAVVEALAMNGLNAWIKWPNDVIVPEGKLAGVLVETSWRGDELDYAVVGIGVNIYRGSIPEVDLEFPATCVEHVLGGHVQREGLLLEVLRSLGRWYRELGSKELLEAWGQHLAYQNEQVILQGKGSTTVGRLQGLALDGSLILKTGAGDTVTLGGGDLSLRPIDSDKD